MSKLFVTGLFKTRAAAEAAVDAIIKRGYTRDDISVLMSDATKNKEFAVETRTHAADGLGIGGAIGGTVGAVLAALVAVGTAFTIPGVGLVVAGPIAAALAGAGAGGATGGLIGLLIGTGIPEHRAKVDAHLLERCFVQRSGYSQTFGLLVLLKTGACVSVKLTR